MQDTLLEEWQALLTRRPAFRPTLAPYATILTAWAQWSSPGPTPLRWDEVQCRARWQRGVPLLSEAAPRIAADELEGVLGPTLDVLASISADADPLRRFGEAWDRGEVSPSDLFPTQGRLGAASVHAATGLSQESLAFLACVSLRPVLEPYFADCRSHLGQGSWTLGVCPFCGAPPGFADLLEDGQRRLACHVCGGGWSFARLRCPHCGSQRAEDLVRLLAEDAEEGYAIFACKACRGYVKELDRRVRWNVGPALVEDWGTPHLDLVARREEYWRAVPTLIQIGGGN